MVEILSRTTVIWPIRYQIYWKPISLLNKQKIELCRFVRKKLQAGIIQFKKSFWYQIKNAQYNLQYNLQYNCYFTPITEAGKLKSSFSRFNKRRNHEVSFFSGNFEVLATLQSTFRQPWSWYWLVVILWCWNRRKHCDVRRPFIVSHRWSV